MPRVNAASAPRRRQREPERPVLRVVAKGEAPVDAVADDLARRYAACRSLGHTWQDVGWASAEARVPFGEYNAYAYVSACSRCGTHRTKWMSRYGNRGTVQYD